MDTTQISYIVFGAVVVLALVFDLGLLSKKNKVISIKTALYQTFFWVSLALGFFVFMWVEKGRDLALEYLSAYLMEWSLSIDNIFVFILIFTAFGIQQKHYGRVLLIGILMAVVFRVLFITLGVALVAKFSWILYIFGVFLLFTGYKMFTAGEDDEFRPHESKLYKFLTKYLPVVAHDGDGKYRVDHEGKKFYTTITIVILLLAGIDLVFALDSIPAVMGITRDTLVIYTSNIFAVLGLRSLFFLLKGAVAKFDYLQQGIAIVLMFIGVKMLAEHWISQWMSKNTQVIISLGVIVLCISGSIFYSVFMKKGEVIKEEDNFE
ncbi:MAG TPA: TerC/Alx family metal homeostasis membrane protein [Ferruginibacter sp.]|nr:TerC/Alx family metal homeostasis membrane protein [Ferruginibacter sp.]HPH91649.1 TerC/Alx family metal homeostasis membrane protein [Ferruginibacter sp.]